MVTTKKGIGYYIVFLFIKNNEYNIVYLDAICMSDCDKIPINQIPQKFHGDDITVIHSWTGMPYAKPCFSKEEAIKQAYREDMKFDYLKNLPRVIVKIAKNNTISGT